MSPIDFEALRGDGAQFGTPSDGPHLARLTRADLVTASGGDRLVTEWEDMQVPLKWQSWNRFDTTGMQYSRDLIQALGVTISMTDDEALADALHQRVGKAWRVTTNSSLGSQGDRVFINTYVVGAAGPPTPDDVPIDTEGLPEPKGWQDTTVPF